MVSISAYFRISFRNEELHNLYSSSDIIMKIKYKRFRLAGRVVCMGT
jgi:hypothetical protein